MKEHFRGELKHEYMVEVTVKEKIVKKAKKISVQNLNVEKDTIEIIPFKGKETIELGQKIMYTARIHGSVGVGAKVWEENNGILKLVDSQFEYEKVQVKGMTGGDAAFKTFVFEGVKVGKSTITIQEFFRGELKNEYTIVIKVVETK